MSNNYRQVEHLILNNHDVTYKLLSIGMVKFNGDKFFQVHCDRQDIQFSKLYHEYELRAAVQKYFYLHSMYISSEGKYGDFVPLEKVRKSNVSI